MRPYNARKHGGCNLLGVNLFKDAWLTLSAGHYGNLLVGIYNYRFYLGLIQEEARASRKEVRQRLHFLDLARLEEL